MSIISDIFSGGAEGLLKGVGTLAKDIRSAITGEESLSAEQRVKLAEMASAIESAALAADMEIAKAQTAINIEEARSDGIFKGGWRPAVGWVCVAGLGYTFIIRPMLPWLVGLFGSQVPAMPSIQTDELMILLTGMLGLGGFRTFERVRSQKA
ncbi:MAG: 3TM-type holin [Geobacteraceae bacterium]|jgi:hypothetical protein|nr:3TM-type holin [Geobacteraceae bacterium]